MSAVGVSLIPAAALAVPVVPNFTQGSMTSHTETTSKVTETINSIDYATGWQYSVSGTNVDNGGQSLSPTQTTTYYLTQSQNGVSCTDSVTVTVNPIGCTDSTAFNYDSMANTDNNSCVVVVEGCMDQSAYNYNISDPSLQSISRFNPNIGVGFYLQSQNYYVSLSTPKMLDTKRAKDEAGFASVATDQAHYYFSTGRTFEVSPSLDIIPSVMVRYVNGAPFSTDFTTTLKYDDKINFGVTYRTDRTLAGLASINVNKKFALGYAYEYSVRSETLGRANGSNEFFLSYKFN